MSELTDDSPMPFGKYGPKPRGEGLTMANIPDRYLTWIYDQQLAGKICYGDAQRVKDYCEENAAVLGIKIFKKKKKKLKKTELEKQI